MRLALLACIALLSSVLCAPRAGFGDGAAAPVAPEPVLTVAEGGDPIPDDARAIAFPWIGKQSVLCVGDSVERQIAFIDFSSEKNEADGSANLGAVSFDEKRVCSGSFVTAAKSLRTGHAYRDQKLLSEDWLHAEKHPTLGLTIRGMKRLKPTVWEVVGAWTMRGVSKDVTFQVNARYVGEMRNVGDRVVRITGRFDLDFADFGVGGDSLGSAAVARVWTVDVGLLGVITE